jgi:hypothetical protein
MLALKLLLMNTFEFKAPMYHEERVFPFSQKMMLYKNDYTFGNGFWKKKNRKKGAILDHHFKFKVVFKVFWLLMIYLKLTMRIFLNYFHSLFLQKESPPKSLPFNWRVFLSLSIMHKKSRKRYRKKENAAIYCVTQIIFYSITKINTS